jgi:succinate dehydrogenase / fumarate reductase membrane anchor subunit
MVHRGAHDMSLRSPLGRVLGLGSAHSGVRHWWQQRLTSVALVPLAIWFLVSLLALPSLGYETVIAWMSQASTAILLVLFVVVATWHSQLGVRVVVEDYVHGEGARTLTLVIVTFAHVLVASAGVFAVLKVAFGVAR